MSMAYMYMLDVHLFDVALCRPNIGSFSTIIEKHKNNNQMAQKVQAYANSQCVLEMI